MSNIAIYRLIWSYLCGTILFLDWQVALCNASSSTQSSTAFLLKADTDQVSDLNYMDSQIQLRGLLCRLPSYPIILPMPFERLTWNLNSCIFCGNIYLPRPSKNSSISIWPFGMASFYFSAASIYSGSRCCVQKIELQWPKLRRLAEIRESWELWEFGR